MAKKAKKPDLKDKVVAKEGGQFIYLYAELTESVAYRSLCPGARCLLQEMMALVWPDRNGRVAMSHERAAGLVGCTKKTAGKYLEMLLVRGFLKLEKGELWQQRLAREYSLTMVTRQGRQPSHDYLRWSEGDNFFGANKKFAGVNETPEQEHLKPQKTDKRLKLV